MNKVVVLFIYIFLAAPVYGADVWVNPAGSNTSPFDTKEKGATTAIHSIDIMQPGDTLIYATGTYASDNDRIRRIPSGHFGEDETDRTPDDVYTVVRCETDFECILEGLTTDAATNNNWNNERCPLGITNKRYIDVSGFIIKDVANGGDYPIPSVHIRNSSNIKIRKIGIRNGARFGTDYQQALDVSYSNYTLLEDVFICGYQRDGINIGGVASQGTHNIILRRCVVRWDFHNGEQPRRAINVYGGYSGEGTSAESPGTILMQNCMVIDGNNAEAITGGFAVAHGVSNVHRYGCLSLSNYGFGFHSSEGDEPLNYVGDNTNTHCVAWNDTGDMWWAHLDYGISGAYYCTISGKGINGSEDAGRGSTYDCEAHDNVVIDGNISNVTEGVGDAANLIYADVGESGYTYIVRSPSSTAGATILFQMGASGTLFGEDGYNTLTSAKLWPWPYEQEIKALFMEPNDSAGYDPPDNNSMRGFCAPDQTLSAYILNQASPANAIRVIGSGVSTVTSVSDIDQYIYFENSTDSDGDGVPDDQDGCPNDINKVEAGICGCGSTDTDPCNARPETPVLITPADAATGIGPSPSFSAGAFQDLDSGDTHAQTIWQIATNAEFNEPVYNETSSEHLTAFTPTDPLAGDTAYYWRACYFDSRGAQSEWSSPFSFTTQGDSGNGSGGSGSAGCFIQAAGCDNK